MGTISAIATFIITSVSFLVWAKQRDATSRYADGAGTDAGAGGDGEGEGDEGGDSDGGEADLGSAEQAVTDGVDPRALVAASPTPGRFYRLSKDLPSLSQVADAAYGKAAGVQEQKLINDNPRNKKVQRLIVGDSENSKYIRDVFGDYFISFFPDFSEDAHAASMGEPGNSYAVIYIPRKDGEIAPKTAWPVGQAPELSLPPPVDAAAWLDSLQSPPKTYKQVFDTLEAAGYNTVGSIPTLAFAGATADAYGRFLAGAYVRAVTGLPESVGTVFAVPEAWEEDVDLIIMWGAGSWS